MNASRAMHDTHPLDVDAPTRAQGRPIESGEAFIGLTLIGLIVYATAIVAAITRAEGIADGAGSSLSDWLSALGAVGALLAASGAAWAAWSTLTVERRRDGVLEAERRQAHASTVAVWVSDVTDRLLTSLSGEPELDVVTINLRNASALPVTEVKVAILFELEPGVLKPFGDLRTIPVLPPSEGEPHEVRMQTLLSVRLDEFVNLHSTPLNRVVIRLRFKDASGLEWRRDTPGTLCVRSENRSAFWCRHEFGLQEEESILNEL
ncbi:hypothetical protein L2K70_07625 [Nocardioides KLBMP 9356]|uniref:Uncharacterized protein n=1 Tax=Nocardioides potassii TaxID=2911371 RepID=A0ABS9H8C7_9ACTN|nr:hypothetical protein [Nocardioides potassii]MCF6377471.1 hypothetical protein [Nocardioides potassii]